SRRRPRRPRRRSVRAPLPRRIEQPADRQPARHVAGSDCGHPSSHAWSAPQGDPAASGRLTMSTENRNNSGLPIDRTGLPTDPDDLLIVTATDIRREQASDEVVAAAAGRVWERIALHAAHQAEAPDAADVAAATGQIRGCADVQ